MKPEADATINIRSFQCPACSAWPLLETSFVCPDTRLCVWESKLISALGTGYWRLVRVCGHPNICGQRPCTVSCREGKLHWTAQGQLCSAEKATSSPTSIHWAGDLLLMASILRNRTCSTEVLKASFTCCSQGGSCGSSGPHLAQTIDFGCS